MSSGSRRLIQIEKACGETFSFTLLIDSRPLDRREDETFRQRKGLRRCRSPHYYPPDPALLAAVRTSPVQRLHSIKPLLLVGREKRPDLRVELFEHHIRFGSRFLMNGLELRSHASDERFDLALLRVGQLKRSRQHHGQVL